MATPTKRQTIESVRNSLHEVTTWADSFGTWHARTESETDARVAIWCDIALRQGATPRPVEVESVEPGHWVEV